MKLAVVGHSLIHPRQQAFFREVASQGHDVVLFCPQVWGPLRTFGDSWLGDSRLYENGSFALRPLPVIGAPDMYEYNLLGLVPVIMLAEPDIVYVQQEVHSYIADLVIGASSLENTKKAIFVWENLREPSPYERRLLDSCDKVICGNDAALRLHAPNPRETGKYTILPQVGVDTDHFQARPGVQRDVSVGFVGRPVAEKGYDKLLLAWPLAKVTPWTDWAKLPWIYSTARVVPCLSQDTPAWREQAMPYVAVEALSSGCFVVASNAGAIPFWLFGGYTEDKIGAPGVYEVAQDAPPSKVREAIALALLDAEKGPNDQGRSWVIRNLSNPVIARRLVEEFASLVD